MERPNILIFMTDQQRGDTVPPYGRAITPNLDRFRREGVTFSQTYCPSPHCCPSRATFFTGLYPSEHGVWNNVNVGNALSRGVNDGVRLFSEDLRDAGYRLAFSGKWHVSNEETPGDRGWDASFVTGVNAQPGGARRPNTYEWERYLKRAEEPEPTERREGEILRPGYSTYTHYGVRENPFRDGDVVQDALQLLRNRGAEGTPWCQYIGTLGPHDPYFVPQEYLDLYDSEAIELPENFTDLMNDKPALYRRTRGRFDQLSEAEHREAIRHYLAFCTYEDALFGEVLSALEETGEAENTVVLYVSDHGDYVAEHGLWCKGLPCFRGAYHVPAIIRWPKGVSRPGRDVDAFVSLADFAPTFLELAGVETERTFTGQSLTPFLRDEEPHAWRDAVFTQSNGNELYGIQRSVTTRDWKYIYNGFDFDELYDLQCDPGETRNLAGDPQYADIVRAMAGRMWRFAYERQDVCVNQYIMVSLAPFGPAEAFRCAEDPSVSSA